MDPNGYLQLKVKVAHLHSAARNTHNYNNCDLLNTIQVK